MTRALFSYNECDERIHQQDHVLESCYLCARPFMSDSDIFMYRGNTPFCSEDCRQEQIEFDEAREGNKRKQSMIKSMDSDQACSTGDIRHNSINVA